MHSVGIVVGEDVDKELEPFSVHVASEPYKVFMEPGDVESMADHYKINPGDLRALCEKMVEWNESEGFVEGNRLGYWSTENPNWKFEYYEVGGRWKSFMKLKAPRKSFWWFFGVKGSSEADAARMHEVDLDDLLAKEPAFVVIDGKWHEGEMDLAATLRGESDTAWKKTFQELMKRVPAEARITVVDIHS